MRLSTTDQGPMGLVRRYVRRSLTVPGWILAFLACLVLAPFVLPILAIIDIARKSDFVLVRMATWGICYFAFEVYALIVALLQWLGSGFGLNQRLLGNWSFAIQLSWINALAAIAFRLFGVRISVEGLERVEALAGRPILLLLRHASMADVALAIMTLQRPTRYRLRYVLKEELLWDPSMDIVGNRLLNWFVRRKGKNRDQEIERVADLANGLGPYEGVLLYPEGTRFTPTRQARALASIEKHGNLERLERARQYVHVLPPRPGGTISVIERIREQGTPATVVIGAHTGFEGAARLKEILGGDLHYRDVLLRYWTVPLEDLPESTEGLEHWLFDQWSEVDRFVDQHEPATRVRAQRRRSR